MPYSDREKRRAFMADYMRKRRADERAARPAPQPQASEALKAAQAEIARLRIELDNVRAEPPASERRRHEAELRIVQHALAEQRDENAKLKAKLAKQAKQMLDPEGEAARRIEVLKKRNKTLQQQADKWQKELRKLAGFADKVKIAKALTEATTSKEARVEGLQVWNGMRLNNLGNST
jgi:hypothetical protein